MSNQRECKRCKQERECKERERRERKKARHYIEYDKNEPIQFNRDAERLFYSRGNSPVKDQVTDGWCLDSRKRMLVWEADSHITEIRTFYKDQLTIKSRFIMSKSGLKLSYKIRYDKSGAVLEKTIYKLGVPYEIIRYDDMGRVTQKCLYKNDWINTDSIYARKEDSR